jgi:uncharacterized secreted protein with C-terminal beta-propeller domain
MAGSGRQAKSARPGSSTRTRNSTQGYSSTDDQETGVDEPDRVKTNGQVMVVLRQQPLGVQVVDVATSPPQLDGFLPLTELSVVDGLFLVGQDAVVIASSSISPGSTGVNPGGPMVPAVPAGPNINPGGPMIPAPAPAPAVAAASTAASAPAPAVAVPGGLNSTTVAVVVSLADPTAPKEVKTFSYPGDLVGARLIAGQVVLALTSPSRLAWAHPAAEATAGGTAAIACARAYIPPVGTGMGTLSIVSFNPVTGSAGHEVTVLGNAQNMYATATRIYLAATTWRGGVGCCPVTMGAGTTCCRPQPGYACPMVRAPSASPASPASPAPQASPAPPASPASVQELPGTVSTSIYGFDISSPMAPRYLGWGQVPGTLIGPYSMSEFNGYLRVATTVGEPAATPAAGESAVPAQLQGGMVSVLQPDAGALVTEGAVRGLGPGEKIDAVLFHGDLGYVVTSKQAASSKAAVPKHVDPLFVVDLSDPRRPLLAGRVPAPGYLSLMQPLGPGLLAGLGQAAGPDQQAEGLQLEVFNVTNPSRPSLVSRQALSEDAGSPAQTDPHALLWWPSSSLLALAVSDNTGAGTFSGADVWSISSSGTLTKVGVISQPSSAGTRPEPPAIERVAVVGADIYTISQQGVMASDATSLAEVAWLPFQSGPSAS